MEEEKKEVEEQPVVEEVAPAVETPTEGEPLTEAAPVEETSEAPVGEEPAQVDKPKKKSPVGLILIIVLLLILAVLFFVLDPLKLFKKGEYSTEGKDDNTVVTEKEIKSEYRMSGNSIEKFDLAFLILENEEKNKIYSPISIKYALEMLSEGASGESKKQIDAVIGDYKATKYENSANMSFANAMFIRDTFNSKVKAEYKDKLITKYNAEVILDSFENANNINSWINDKTLKLIPNLVDDVSDKDFFLVNALGIDMEWVNQIHCATRKDTPYNELPCIHYNVNYVHEKLEGESDEYERISFPYEAEWDFPTIKFNAVGNNSINAKGSKVLASFNRYDAVKEIGEDKIREEVLAALQEWIKDEGEGSESYYSDTDKYLNEFIEDLNKNYGKAVYSTDFYLHVDDDVKVFAKDLKEYNGKTLQYIGIMPKQVSLKEYIENVSASDINKIISNLKDMKIENFKEGYATIIEGDIPLFKYEYELQLMEDLKKLGITDVFDTDKADLSAMLDDAKEEFIEEAKHKANIEFSNDGIKAAAATEEGGAGNTKWGFNYLYEVPTIRIDLTFDKPYMYLIRDKDTGEVWFIGTVYEPIKK